MESETSKVTRILDMQEGTRVELDFIDALAPDEGVPVGCKASGYVIVLAENRPTQTYPPRPFRVNGGALHQYVPVEGEKTKYLCEIQAGDRVLVTDGTHSRYVTIGRAKVEKRPFRLIELENGVSAVLQDADSIFLADGRDGIHFQDLQPGDEILCLRSENKARHIGTVIDEEITEQ